MVKALLKQKEKVTSRDMKAVKGKAHLVKATNYRAVVVRSATHKAAEG